MKQGNKAIDRNSNFILVLHDCIIDVIDTFSGTIVDQFDTLHLLNYQNPLTTLDRVVSKESAKFSRIAKDTAYNYAVNLREGRTTSLLWCPFTSQIIVGFSTGGICTLVVGTNKKKSASSVHINTTNVHDSAILQLNTFLQPLDGVDSKGKNKNRICLLIGDAKGILSVWNLSER